MIEKILICIKYSVQNNYDDEKEIINKKEDFKEQIKEYVIKEIMLRENWKKIKSDI